VSLIVLGLLTWGAIRLAKGAIALIWPASRVTQADNSDWSNTLVVGIDPRQLPLQPLDKITRRLADSIFVLGHSRRLRQAYIVAIPRETRATLGEVGTGTLGDGMAIGDLRLVSNTVEELTGLTIHHRVTIDPNGARALLAAVGPNDIFFAKPLRYRSMDYKLGIEVGGGWQRLDADKSLAYVFASAREPDERTERLQALFHEWHRRLRSQWAWSLWRFKGVVRDTVATDFQNADLDRLLDDLIRTPPEGVAYATLPGRVNQRGEWLFNSARWYSLKSRLVAHFDEDAPDSTRASIAITYDDPADEKVLLLANALTARGCQVIRTAREPVNQNDLQLIENPQLKQRSAKILAIVTEALGTAPRVVVGHEVAGAYGAQYSLRLGKQAFR